MSESSVDLVAVARWQRRLVLMVAAGVAVQTLPGLIGLANGGFAAADIMLRLWPVGLLVVSAAWAVGAIGLSRALGDSRSVAAMRGLMMAVPLANLVLAAVMTSRATGELKRAGLRVGMTGANRDELMKLEAGHCTGCGYEVSAVVGRVCPECGRSRQAA